MTHFPHTVLHYLLTFTPLSSKQLLSLIILLIINVRFHFNRELQHSPTIFQSKTKNIFSSWQIAHFYIQRWTPALAPKYKVFYVITVTPASIKTSLILTPVAQIVWIMGVVVCEMCFSEDQRGIVPAAERLKWAWTVIYKHGKVALWSKVHNRLHCPYTCILFICSKHNTINLVFNAVSI